MKVLDLLLSIQRSLDATVGFRYSCRVAMCGTCTIRINGRPALACETAVLAETPRYRLEPLAGLPVLRDLVVDMSPFYERWASITPYLVPAADSRHPAIIPPDSPERRLIDASLDCITCGACFASCDIAKLHPGYLGPAALNRAMVLVADSRDQAQEERLARVGSGDGVDRCHYIYGCTAVCPKGLDPAGAIRRLRRWRMRPGQIPSGGVHGQ